MRKKLTQKQEATIAKMKKVRWEDYINLRDKAEKEIKRIDENILLMNEEIEQLKKKLIGFKYGKVFLHKLLENPNKEKLNAQNKN